MTHDQINELPIRRYLLGASLQDEGERLEERLLSDADFFDQLSLVEDELIDEYARGVLPDQERERFDDFFLSTPERRLKLEVLQSLKSYTASDVSDAKSVAPVRQHFPWWAALSSPLGFRSPAVGFSLSLLLLVGLFGITWWIYKSVRSQDPPVQVRVPEQGSPGLESPSPPIPPSNVQGGGDSNKGIQQPDQPPPPREQNTPTPPANVPPTGGNQRDTAPARSAVYAITLSGGLVRGGQEDRGFTIPPATKQIRVSAEFESKDYQKYRAVVRNINTDEQTTLDNLKATVTGKAKRVAFTLSPKTLKTGDYIMSLTGITPGGETEVIGSYYFRITSR